jgi:RNA polymerase-binding protein DksA
VAANTSSAIKAVKGAVAKVARRSTAAAPAKASTSKAAKSAPVKKTAAKKSAPAKGSVASAKKTTPAKATAKKTAAKKTAPAKKAAAKKAPAPAKKAAAKKAPAKKTAAKKAPAAKTVAKKTAPAKKAAPPKKTVTAKRAPVKAAATKAVAKKAPAHSAAQKAAPKAPPTKAAAKPRSGSVGRLVVRDGESTWTAAEIAEVRESLALDAERLRAEIAAAEEEISHLLREGGEGAGNDQADVGSNTFERDHEMSMAKNARDNLQLVEDALHRIEERTYGVCESCGEPIGKLRLQAFPRATLCLQCKQRQERR